MDDCGCDRNFGRLCARFENGTPLPTGENELLSRIKMIQVFENKKCCGCNACINVCPQQCISQREDDQGFFYPVVDTESCINCNLCEKVCPELTIASESKPIATEGIINNNEQARLNSSSGGVFVALAEEIISRGGVVYGASYTADLGVEHISVEKIEELHKLLRSKYIQSNTERCFEEIKKHLRNNRWVMFCGTPCQVQGLRLFLRKDYDQLICVDFICHGVPSEAVFKAYLEAEVLRLGLSSVKEIAKINFRDKSDAGWHRFCPALTPDNSDKPIYVHDSAYMRGFGANLFLRPSCYSCPSKGFKSGADIKLADYWRVEILNPELDDDKGTSLVSVMSDKGMQLLSQCKGLKRKSVVAKDAYRMQMALYNSMPLSPKVDAFWSSDWRTDFINVVNKICSQQSFKDRIIGWIKTSLRDLGVKKFLSIFSTRYK